MCSSDLVFSELPPGRYNISVTRGASTGVATADRARTAVELADGAHVDVGVLHIPAGQDISGQILDEHGKPQLMQMGCYGIGVTRILGAAIEQNFDAKGIIWPASIAPFEVVLCPMGYDRSEAVRSTTEALYAALLEGGVDVIFDDRGERPGAMFADWELIGVPHRVVIGERGLKDGMFEYQGRRDDAPTPVAQAEMTAFLRARLG